MDACYSATKKLEKETSSHFWSVRVVVKDWSELAVAICTGLLAVATFFLAWFTRKTVIDASKARKQTERHHQERLRPLCVVEFHDVDHQYPFGKDFFRQLGLDYNSKSADREIHLKGRLFNKGLGPAKDVVAYLNTGSSVDGQAYWLTHPIVVCGLIAAGESMEIDIVIKKDRVTDAIAVGQQVPAGILDRVASETYEVVLRYTDIFENFFRTVHPKGFMQDVQVDVAIAGGNLETQKARATRQDRPTPLYLKGEQPWRVLAEVHGRPR